MIKRFFRIKTSTESNGTNHHGGSASSRGSSPEFQNHMGPGDRGTQEQNSERFLKALATSSQLTQVRFIPTLLIPVRRTVPYLREAAARFQADLLLIYGTRITTFQRDRLIGADEVHAEAVVESVLLDVRTGIVIHTAQTAESISAKKTPGDLNLSQTVAKAQTEATGKALLKLADAVVSFAGAAK